eukprot:CAMPEP_0203766358 /NCGR_PEP_ID=MMETSP0099_2-20121227/369_1 /ASSEMBLY_ACC=CAM_ASM_000209 /TAXON_ID=96639 /ORGANISM=" , Strain NY0313808BC1" /LENGTH=368 /DNA_ID=CAMNT_0050662691 /DNA_START=129 /DNA_END=1235 /DNA_ORIENTATION=+
MLACHYDTFGGRNVDKVGQIRKVGREDIEDGQMVIKVCASSLNPADYKQRSGESRLILGFKFPQVHGFDFSGQVVESKSNEFKAGDNVFGMCKGLRRGGLAEYMIVDADICVRKPESVSHEDAASVPLTGITAMMAFRKCGLKEFQKEKQPRVLVLGGAGGVGSIAIQLAKSLYNASFVATTASPGKKTEFVKSLGADLVVNYRENDFSIELASKDNAKLFDAILDCTGEVKKCPPLLAQGGGVFSIVESPTVEGLREFLVNSETAQFQKITCGVQGFLESSIGGCIFNRVTGATSLRNRCKKVGGTYNMVIGTGNREMVEVLADQLSKKSIRATIERVYPLCDSLEALSHLEDGHTMGKVVIKVCDL